MYCCLLRRKPLSYKSSYKRDDSKGRKYKEDVQRAFTDQYRKLTKLTDDLYGIVYCFYKIYHEGTDADADNISKPIWDCLTGLIYDDDKQIKLRLAGCYDLSKNQFADLNVTSLAPELLTDLLEALDEEACVIYIECGNFNSSLIRFNLE